MLIITVFIMSTGWCEYQVLLFMCTIHS